MEGAGGEALGRRRRMGVSSFGGIGAFFFVPRKVRFAFPLRPKLPCWLFPILAMTMFEQARHCSFGLTKTLALLTNALVLSNNHPIAA
jgi:hypothetical protein